ncbi:hypothetical protein T265_14646, partial [Opisthorchis viverrini]
ILSRRQSNGLEFKERPRATVHIEGLGDGRSLCYPNWQCLIPLNLTNSPKESKKPMNEPEISKSCTPRRLTDRIRKPVTRMQLNPQLQSYEQ